MSHEVCGETPRSHLGSGEIWGAELRESHGITTEMGRQIGAMYLSKDLGARDQKYPSEKRTSVGNFSVWNLCLAQLGA